MSARSTEDLIARLAADASPVRPIRPARVLGGLLLAAAALFGLFMAVGVPRPDMDAAMARPMFWWKLIAFALPAFAASVGVALAVRPEARLRPVWHALGALAVAVAATGLMLAPGTAAEIADRLWRPEVRNCARSVLGMGLPMAGLFAFALARGAPTRPAEAARMAGLAAGGWACAVFALACPVDDPLYTLTWFTLFAGLVALVATLAAPPLIRASWRRGR